MSIELEQAGPEDIAALERDFGLVQLLGPPQMVETARLARWNVVRAVMAIYQGRVMAIHQRAFASEIDGTERDRLTAFYRHAVEQRMASMNEADLWLDLMEQDPDDIVDGWLFG